MNCIYRRGDTIVTETRKAQHHRWRRRKCKSRGKRFTTYEISADDYDVMVGAKAMLEWMKQWVRNEFDVRCIQTWR